MRHEAVLAMIEEEENVLLLEPRDRFDRCLVGIADRFHDRFAVYDRACVLSAIEADMGPGDEDEDPVTMALEHFEFNVVGAWVGERTPAFLITPEVE